MNILKYKKIFLGISSLLVLLSLASIAYFGFNLGIDFKGGTVYEIQYKKNIPSFENVKNVVSSDFASSQVQKLGENKFVIKVPELTDEKKAKLDKDLTFNSKSEFEPTQLKSISPSVSGEFVNKSI